MGHQREVLARTRLALVRVDHEVVRLAVVLRDEAPLHAGGEAGAATAAQARVLDELDQLVRVGRQRLAQRAVAVESLVRLPLPGVRRRPAPGEHRRELRQHRLRSGVPIRNPPWAGRSDRRRWVRARGPAMPCCSARRRPRRVASPATPSAIASGRSVGEPGQLQRHLLERAQPGAAARSGPLALLQLGHDVPSALSTSTLSKNS